MRRNYCRSVISLQEPLPHSLWISLYFHGILTIVWTPAYPVVSICVRWPPMRRVYNITSSSLLHKKYLLLLCFLLKVSQYQLALIDTASVHIVKVISIICVASAIPVCVLPWTPRQTLVGDPRTRQTTIGKTSYFVMTSERGTLFRGSDPP